MILFNTNNTLICCKPKAYQMQTFLYSICYLISMTQLDLEDINFLEDLAEELRRHDGVYDAEAVELENIIFRAKEDK